jgi:acetyl-CoA C-acetyltransferase
LNSDYSKYLSPTKNSGIDIAKYKDRDAKAVRKIGGKGESNMHDVVITSGMRTPIGNFLGSLKNFSSVDLGIIALKAAISKAGITSGKIEELVTGMEKYDDCKQNTARQVALGAGCSRETIALTVNQKNVSSLRSMEILAQDIELGKVEIGAVVGTESMSNKDNLLYFNNHRGEIAENIAKKYNISRREQDELALLSHQRAGQAIRKNKFMQEVVPIEIKTKRGIVLFDTDEHPKPDTSLEDLSKLKPAFKEWGTVTAGNSSSLNDGAAAMILMSSEKAKELGCKPLARVLSSASVPVDPTIRGIAVVPAVYWALKFANLKLKDIGYWEINESFAVQFLAVNRELKINIDKVNCNGSAISLGHPVSCTGVRLIISLLNEMRRRGVKYGCVSLCEDCGPATAIIIENVQ